MLKSGKRMAAAIKEIDRQHIYIVSEALSLLKSLSSVKFNETIDVAINLGVNAKKSDQYVRGSIVLPNGTGKVLKVAVFANGDDAELAKIAGADLIGSDDLVNKVQQGEINFDVCIATPDTMNLVGKLGKILGPRGMMPNPKVGTVTKNVTKAVNDAKSGQVQYRIDKSGIIHCPIGKISFSSKDLEENLNALISSLIQSKPHSSKGKYIQQIALSSTMGPSIKVDCINFSTIK